MKNSLNVRPCYYEALMTLHRPMGPLSLLLTLTAAQLVGQPQVQVPGQSGPRMPKVGIKHLGLTLPLSGPNGQITVMAVSNSRLVIAGEFSEVAGVKAPRIAQWDGSHWSSLGQIGDGEIRCIAIRGSEVYVGGDFLTAGTVRVNGIASWDGQRWSDLAGGVSRRSAGSTPSNASVRAIAFSDTEIYIGGEFDHAGASPAISIAAWDGMKWKNIGSESDDPHTRVNALVKAGKYLYAAGIFERMGGVQASSVARWDGKAWTALSGAIFHPTLENLKMRQSIFYDFFPDGGPNPLLEVVGEISAIASEGTNLYVTGPFDQIDSLHVSGLARWDGSGWSSMNDGSGEHSGVIAAAGHKLYSVHSGWPLSSWDGSKWTSDLSNDHLSFLDDPTILALAADGDSVWVGGGFSQVADQPRRSLALYDGAHWLAPDTSRWWLMRQLRPALEAARIVVGFAALWFAMLVYPDERGKLQNRLEDLWVKVAESRELAMTAQLKFLRGISRLTGMILGRVFGISFVSVRGLVAGVAFSLSSVGLVCLLPVLVIPWAGWPDGPVLAKLISLIFPSKTPLALWTSGFFLVGVSGVGLTRGWRTAIFAAGAVSIFIVLTVFRESNPEIWKLATPRTLCAIALVGLTSSLLFTAGMRYVVNWIHSSGSVLYIGGAILSSVTAAVFPTWVLVQALQKLGLLGFTGATLIVPLGANINALYASVFVLLMVIILVHTISWPLLERTIASLAQNRVVHNRKFVGALGAALVGSTFLPTSWIELLSKFLDT